LITDVFRLCLLPRTITSTAPSRHPWRHRQTATAALDFGHQSVSAQLRHLRGARAHWARSQLGDPAQKVAGGVKNFSVGLRTPAASSRAGSPTSRCAKGRARVEDDELGARDQGTGNREQGTGESWNHLRPESPATC